MRASQIPPFYGWVSGVLKVISWQGWSCVHQVGQI